MSEILSLEKSRKKSTAIVVLSIILGVMTIGVVLLTIFLVLANGTVSNYGSMLEVGYQKSYYNLVDDINNAEVRMSKVLSSSDDIYTGNLLHEIQKNANDAQNNLNALPVSLNGVEESITFINQLGGYCETLSKKIAEGGTITENERETLAQLYDCLLTMKLAFENISQDMGGEYNILSNSLSIKKDYNDFTVQLQSIKTNDVDYPTMIYDGPFADSQVRKEVRGLDKQNVVSVEEAKEKLSTIFSINSDDISHVGETNGNFETYDFTFEANYENEVFAQMSKAEGRLITLASFKEEGEVNLSVDAAKSIAENFVISTGIENVRSVWHDVVGGCAYFNFAPIKNGVVLYPDLVKVKCDLTSGNVLGYEARSYYINHVSRNLPEFVITETQAEAKVKDNYVVQNVTKVLAPINFGEVLCYECECAFDGDTYYVYVNAITGSVDNILKVIKTDDGNKIM